MLKSKKSQITIFVIIALIIVVGIAFVYVVTSGIDLGVSSE
jgi:cytochrome bd-type quinol oxidase subunit 2